MADNVELNAGSGGATIATDDVSSVHFQRVKLDIGGDGVSSPVVSGNGLPITGTVTANLGTTDNAVLDSIAAATAATQTAVEGTLTVGSHAVTNAGTFAVQSAQSGSWSVTAVGAAAENAAVSGNPVLMAGRYDSSARTLGNGDAGALALNASGQLLVEIAAGAGSGGTAAADDADFTAGTTSGTPVMGVYESSPTSVTDGDLGTVGITQTRALKVHIASFENSQTDDAAFTPGTDPVSVIGATFDDSTPDSVDEGDAGAVRMSANRNLYTTIRDAAGNERGLNINADGSINVDFPNFEVDANNSTTSTLTANTDFTGTATDLSAYAGVTVTVFADQASDANGMKFQFSSDGTNWDLDIAGGFDYAASTTRQFQFPCYARYFRVVFQNAGTGQTAFRLQTLLHHHTIALTSIHRADADVGADRSAQLVKAVVVAQTSGAGNFVPVAANAQGRLQVASDTGLDTDIGTIAGAVSGTEMQVDVVAALPAGTNNIGDVDIASAIPAGTNMIGRVEQNVSVSATGTTTYYDADLDETAVGVDAGAVNIYSIQAFNTTDAPLFLQLFNVASGSVTVGTTTPTNQYVIPGNADSDGAGFTITFGVPKTYGTALTVACTTNSEGNGAPGAGACIVNIEYAT